MASALRSLHPTASMICGSLGRGSRAGAAAAAAAPVRATPTVPTTSAEISTATSATGSYVGHVKFVTTGSRGGNASGAPVFFSFARSGLSGCASAVRVPKSSRCASAFRFWEKRSFSSTTGSAAKELVKTINHEIQHEQSTYEVDKGLKKFLQTSGWTLTEQENDMMVTLKREVGGKKVVVEFSCVQNAEAPAGEEGPAAEMSDFTVTITKTGQEEGEGITFYCSTTQDEEEKFRYCVGQVRLFKGAEEKESLSAYPGPYFEDLDDAFQQSLDDWLSKMGVDNDLCDFIDKYSVDKESREYLTWLKKLAHFVAEEEK